MTATTYEIIRDLQRQVFNLKQVNKALTEESEFRLETIYHLVLNEGANLTTAQADKLRDALVSL